MRRSVRETLRARYRFRCAHCGTTEVDAGGELTVDHFQPRFHAGAETVDNLVYACIACNDFKGDYWKPGSAHRILHPLKDDLSVHLRETVDGAIEPLTETGRFHIDRLHLNRPQLVAQRQHKRELETLRVTLARLEEENENLHQQIAAVEAQIRLTLDEADQQTKS